LLSYMIVTSHNTQSKQAMVGKWKTQALLTSPPG